MLLSCLTLHFFFLPCIINRMPITEGENIIDMCLWWRRKLKEGTYPRIHTQNRQRYCIKKKHLYMHLLMSSLLNEWVDAGHDIGIATYAFQITFNTLQFIACASMVQVSILIFTQ